MPLWRRSRIPSGSFPRKQSGPTSYSVKLCNGPYDGQSLFNVQATNNKEIAEKRITLHTLRHSIATHLLQHEVKLENIKTFLGHSSLESTQIYTHLLKTIEND